MAAQKLSHVCKNATNFYTVQFIPFSTLLYIRTVLSRTSLFSSSYRKSLNAPTQRLQLRNTSPLTWYRRVECMTFSHALKAYNVVHPSKPFYLDDPWMLAQFTWFGQNTSVFPSLRTKTRLSDMSTRSVTKHACRFSLGPWNFHRLFCSGVRVNWGNFLHYVVCRVLYI